MNLERWKQFALKTKMGNIGSEVARARLCKEKQDSNGEAASLKRVLEMIDLTISDLPNQSEKKELSLMRELICVWQEKKGELMESPLLLKDFFTQFAYLK